MTGIRGLTLLVGCFALAIAGASPLAAQNGASFALEPYLRDSLGLDAKQMADVQRGHAVAKILPTELNRDVTVFGVIGVHVARDAYALRLHDARTIVGARTDEFGIISDPATSDDLRGVSIDKSEYKDLRSCKPGDCDFKLPAAFMREFSEGVDWNGRQARDQVDSLFRIDLQRIVANYRSAGNAGMVRYDDTGGVQAGDAFAALLAQSWYVRDHAPELRDYLATYPTHRPEGAIDAIYWREERLPHLRPTVTLNHMVAFTTPTGTPLLVRKQIYANHYFEGAFELIAAFDAPSLPGGPGIYLVSVRRYRFDSLPGGGFLNIRGRVRNRLADQVKSDLERERAATESARHG